MKNVSQQPVAGPDNSIGHYDTLTADNVSLRKEVATLKAMLSEVTRKWQEAEKLNKELKSQLATGDAEANDASDDSDPEADKIQIEKLGDTPGFTLKPRFDATGNCVEIIAKVVPDMEKKRKKKKKKAKRLQKQLELDENQDGTSTAVLKSKNKPNARKRKQYKERRVIVAELDNAVLTRAVAIGTVDSQEASLVKAQTHARLSKIRTAKPVRLVDSAQRLEDLLLEELYKGKHSSFYLVNLGFVVEKYLEWKRLFPRIMPCYAVKSNPDMHIVRTLKFLGAGFDCASKNEMEQILSIGGTPDEIIYANPCKPIDHIAFARDRGIKLMTFDSADELRKMVSIHPEGHYVLRLLADDSLSKMRFGTKFGASRTECRALFELANEISRERGAPINLVGLSFHVGSGCTHYRAWCAAVRLAREIMDDAEALGIKMSLLDIGGGFPGVDEEVKPGQDPIDALTMRNIAAAVTPLIDELFPPHIRVISEPGRYFCTSAYTLAVTVVSRRERLRVDPAPTAIHDRGSADNSGDESTLSPAAAAANALRAPPPVSASHGSCSRDATPPRDASPPPRDGSPVPAEGDDTAKPKMSKEILYYLSDGVYGSFNNTVFDHYEPRPHRLLSPNSAPVDLDHHRTPSDGGSSKSSLFGPTCDSLDVICRDIDLPDLNIGDVLYFTNMGAYTVASGSAFNGFTLPNALYVMSVTDPRAAISAKPAPEKKLIAPSPAASAAAALTSPERQAPAHG